jgi:hypothetical protein
LSFCTADITNERAIEIYSAVLSEMKDLPPYSNTLGGQSIITELEGLPSLQRTNLVIKVMGLLQQLTKSAFIHQLQSGITEGFGLTLLAKHHILQGLSTCALGQDSSRRVSDTYSPTNNEQQALAYVGGALIR